MWQENSVQESQLPPLHINPMTMMPITVTMHRANNEHPAHYCKYDLIDLYFAKQMTECTFSLFSSTACGWKQKTSNERKFYLARHALHVCQ